MQKYYNQRPKDLSFLFLDESSKKQIRQLHQAISINILSFQKRSEIMKENHIQVDRKHNTTSKIGYGLVFAISQMRGWRQFMQDAHISTPLTDIKNYLFGVFDGHGGSEVAHFVKKNFKKQLQKNLNFKKKNYQEALVQTFLKMDELLFSTSGQSQLVKINKQMVQKQNGYIDFNFGRVGCTANVCLVTQEWIYVANSGDSRSIGFTIKGQCIELSKDHRPQNHDQYSRIKKAGGKIIQGRINGRLNVSRSIGDYDYKNDKSLSSQDQLVIPLPDIIAIKNQGIQFIIMGCDGIWEKKSNLQMGKWINERLKAGKELGKVLQELFDQLVASDYNKSETGLDNMSAILIKFLRSKR